MDEDELDYEELNELESRLYGQIHHEAQQNDTVPPSSSIAACNETVTRTVTNTTVINKPINNSKVPSNRYWNKEQKDKQNSNNNDLNKTVSNQNMPSPSKTNISSNTSSKSNTSTTGSNNNISNPIQNSPKSINSNNPFAKRKDLLINPLNSKFNNKNKQKKQHMIKPAHLKIPPSPPNILKNGPFASQIQKLNKAKRLEAKKQKAQQVRSKNKKSKQITATIDLVSDENDTNGSDADVIEIPVPPPPTYTVQDSDDEKIVDVDIKPNHCENANDACDVVLTKSCFTKPGQISSITEDNNRNAVENSSRCTSPGSVMSSDDFLGQTDRRRLLEDSGVADDEDLLLLTAGVDSLMEIPVQREQSKSENLEENLVIEDDESNSNSMQPPTKSISEIIAKNNYRVEQREFRALDVYESESDITDSIYSKGTAKATVIRNVDSNSSSADDDVQIVPTHLKSKKKRKRRPSSSNKDGQPDAIGNTDETHNSDSEDSDDLNQTAIPYIIRGVAVERLRSKRSGRKNSVRRTSSGGSGHMSDNEFLATLNTLAQGKDDESCADEAEDLNSDEDINIPTARDIAEKVLEQTGNHQADDDQVQESPSNKPDQPATVEVSVHLQNDAIPQDALNSLDTVFHTIDEMDKQRKLDENTYEISDNSDVEIKQSKNEASKKTQAATTTNTVSVRKRSRTKSPVYHVVYSRGPRFSGIGWNDEMKKFYNNSWKGENFNLHQLWQTMDGNKSLWKIYSEDRFPKTKRYTNLKCHNCLEFGHTRAKCKRPKKPLICFMCGESGHLEPRCSNTICLRCGNKTQVFTKSCNSCTFQNRLICPICKVRGHTLNLCPDKWRRYHSTTQPNEYPNSEIEYKSRKCCCVCGEIGHLAENCKSAVRFNEYPIIVSDVKSHQKSYNDQVISPYEEIGIGYNLLYEPSEDFSFELAENTKPNDYYGRFLKAVGLGHLLKRKRKMNTTANESGSSKKVKQHSEEYKRNPYGKSAAKARSEKPLTETEPEQVQEISESGNTETESLVQSVQIIIPAPIEVQTESGTFVETHEATEHSNDLIGENEEEQYEVIDEVVTDATVETSPSTTLTGTPNAENDDSQFKTPNDPSESPIENTNENAENLPLDSDSNYSFSEHFEMPSSSAQKSKKSRKMEPLPDFIPLMNSAAAATNAGQDKDNDEDDEAYFPLSQAGISRKFITADSETSDAEGNSPLPDLPCEAKIYLTHFHSKYLLSPDGHAFLLEKSKVCNIKARLDWTTVGHVLVIYGLRENQDNFHRELLLKYRQLSDQMNRKRLENYQKVPKRVDVLIRFLRDSINQLLNNLGNVNDLLKKLKYLENQHSKSGYKGAEKTRRSLNMILLGQAGLKDGNMHLDKLLHNLKSLINDFKIDEIAPNKLREDIDSHWKMIFTSYRHDNYAELVQDYNKLLSKSRLQKLNIDPILLGHAKKLDVSLTAEQKERLEQATAAKTPKKSTGHAQKQNNSQTHQSSPPPPPAPSMKMRTKGTTLNEFCNNKAATSSSSSSNATNQQGSKNNSKKNPPFAKPQQRSKVSNLIKEANKSWTHKCNTLLSELETQQKANSPPSGGSKKKGLIQDCKAPSMFWSRESLKYLSDCLKMAEGNRDLTDKLLRVEVKSKSGSLSYNDYRAVIKLHSAMMGN